ncbi:MAG TPA: hypothetical protein VGG24_04445 [Paraburkholderia sp.]|jgi:hypothetical protein
MALIKVSAADVRLNRPIPPRAENGDFMVGAQLNVAAAETRALLRAFVFEVATSSAI